MTELTKLTKAMGDLDEAEVLALVETIAADKDTDIIAAVKACQDGLAIVGNRFESGEYFVGDLIFSGVLMNSAFDVLRPRIAAQNSSAIGKIVLCTVEGDLHDIGKNIIKCMMETAGFEVIDLGIDTPVSKIITALRETGATILALSGVLTLAINSMKRTIDELCAQGMRSGIKVIIGGAPVTEEYCRLVGADAWSINAAQGVKICRDWADED